MQEENSIPPEVEYALERTQAMQDVFFVAQGFLPDRPEGAIPAEASEETFVEMLTAIYTAAHFHGLYPPALGVEAWSRTRQLKARVRNG